LEKVRTATYDFTSKTKNPTDGKPIAVAIKGFYLAPSRERNEMSMSFDSDRPASKGIMILDHQAMKGLALDPDQKQAIAINLTDLTKIKRPSGPTNPFDMVREIVQQGSSAIAGKVESLGKKQIDGHLAVGFRIHTNLADQTFWADPDTARLIRLEYEQPDGSSHGVMTNFHYDMELDPSLFSLEPPPGYTVKTIEMSMPVEDDLINTLRFIAEHNDGGFPSSLAYVNKDFQQAIMAAAKEESEKLMKAPETQKLMEKLKAQYGSDKESFRKEWMKQWMELATPNNQKLMLKYMQGLTFYTMLTAQNDSHYAGKGIKLDTPDTPIFWYKPTGSKKYRVIYADLSVKEVAPDEVPKVSEAESARQ